MSADNGGPAFPVSIGDCNAGHQDGGSTWQFHGMMLRDYFAAKALPTLINLCQDGDGSWSGDNVAQNAYWLADAMLAERAK